eukprot:945625-Prorocentrum_lima.AAC.1
MRQISSAASAAADPFAAFHWFSAVQIPGSPLQNKLSEGWEVSFFVLTIRWQLLSWRCARNRKQKTLGRAN